MKFSKALLILLSCFVSSSFAARPSLSTPARDVTISESTYFVTDDGLDGKKVYSTSKNPFVKKGEVFYWVIKYSSTLYQIPLLQIVESDVPNNWTMTLGHKFEISEDRRTLTHRDTELNDKGMIIFRWSHEYDDPTARMKIRVKLGDAPEQVFEYDTE